MKILTKTQMAQQTNVGSWKANLSFPSQPISLQNACISKWFLVLLYAQLDIQLSNSKIVSWLHRQHKTKNSVWPKQRYKFARICPSAGFVRWCYQYLCNGNTVCFEVERSLFRSCSPMKSRIKVGWWRDTHFCRPCSWRHRFRLPDTKWRRSWPCFRDFESLILNNLDHHSTEKQPGDFCFVLIHSSR